jgi:hypothetical protein
MVGEVLADDWAEKFFAQMDKVQAEQKRRANEQSGNSEANSDGVEFGSAADR